MFGKKRGALASLSLTSWIILVTALFSIVAFFSSSLFSLLALNVQFVMARPWTLASHILLHGGFFHLFVNMFSLFFIGSLTERIIGRKRMFWLYLISGIIGGIAFVFEGAIAADFILANAPDVYAVGASGALFGIAGVLLFLTPNLPVYVMFIPIPIKMKYALPLMLLALWVLSASAGLPIGNSSHLGGFLAGLAYGFYLKKKYPRKVGMINQFFR